MSPMTKIEELAPRADRAASASVVTSFQKWHRRSRHSGRSAVGIARTGKKSTQSDRRSFNAIMHH